MTADITGGACSAAYGPPRPVRSPRPLIRAALLVAMVVSLAAAASALADGPFGPGYVACGSFHASGYRIRVYAAHVTCTQAVRIQKEYWLGKRKDRQIFNGGSGASGYVLLKKYPGWRCTSGSGGG